MHLFFQQQMKSEKEQEIGTLLPVGLSPKGELTKLSGPHFPGQLVLDYVISIARLTFSLKKRVLSVALFPFLFVLRKGLIAPLVDSHHGNLCPK